MLLLWLNMLHSHACIMHILFICIDKSILFLTFLLYSLFFTIIVYCEITVLWQLWQRNFPVSRTMTEFWFWVKLFPRSSHIFPTMLCHESQVCTGCFASLYLYLLKYTGCTMQFHCLTSCLWQSFLSTSIRIRVGISWVLLKRTVVQLVELRALCGGAKEWDVRWALVFRGMVSVGYFLQACVFPAPQATLTALRYSDFLASAAAFRYRV